jgi:hypothetical protein
LNINEQKKAKRMMNAFNLNQMLEIKLEEKVRNNKKQYKKIESQATK